MKILRPLDRLSALFTIAQIGMVDSIDRTWSRAEGVRVSFYAAPVDVRAVGILTDVPSDGRTPSLGSSCPDYQPAARDDRPDIPECMKAGETTGVRKVANGIDPEPVRNKP